MQSDGLTLARGHGAMVLVDFDVRTEEKQGKEFPIPLQKCCRFAIKCGRGKKIRRRR